MPRLTALPVLPRRQALLGLALPLLAPRRADAFLLVTPEEVAASASNPAPSGGSLTRSLSVGAPRIEVDSPDGSLAANRPVSFRLRFVPAQGAGIDPESFRAFYGTFGIDITGRLKPHARIDATGVRADNVEIPEGSHRVVMTVTDTQGRTGRREVRFTVN